MRNSEGTMSLDPPCRQDRVIACIEANGCGISIGWSASTIAVVICTSTNHSLHEVYYLSGEYAYISALALCRCNHTMCASPADVTIWRQFSSPQWSRGCCIVSDTIRKREKQKRKRNKKKAKKKNLGFRARFVGSCLSFSVPTTYLLLSTSVGKQIIDCYLLTTSRGAESIHNIHVICTCAFVYVQILRITPLLDRLAAKNSKRKERRLTSFGRGPRSVERGKASDEHRLYFGHAAAMQAEIAKRRYGQEASKKGSESQSPLMLG